MAGFTAGALVEITGLPGAAQPVPEAEGLEPINLNSQKAQLLRFDRSSQKWLAMTFNGDMIAVDQKYTRLLDSKDLGVYDFVFGPSSDFNTVGFELGSVLATKGYAIMRLLVSEEDVSNMLLIAEQLHEDGQFSRLAVEFERGYLGKDSAAKTLLLDPGSPDAPDWIRDSAFRTMDNNFSAISQLLGPHSRETLGFPIYSRTNMLLRLPLGETDEDRYPPADIDNGDVEGYLHTMVRKRLTVMQFVGPASGLLLLHPLGAALAPTPGQEAGDIRLPADPHTLVFIVASRFDYTYRPQGDSLALTSFFLAEPVMFEISGQICANVDGLDLISGPPPPQGEQCQVDALHCRYGGSSEGRLQFWSAAGRAGVDGVTSIPLERWDFRPYYDPDMLSPGYVSYTKHGCFGIDGVDLFDSRFFEVSVREAKCMDPCQRQVLEVSYMSLLEGGWDKRGLMRQAQNIGHFVGIDKDDWTCMSAAGLLDMSGAMGAASAASSIVSNRFSYALNLKGASMNIDTACSSSLVAAHVAKLHLRSQDTETLEAAIVNGVNLMLYYFQFAVLCHAGMLSREGRCMTYDASVDGQARGECCGSACIKLLQYLKDHKAIGSLAGSQANQDGCSANLAAPNGPAQERCVSAVFKECCITPAEVDCLEAHGAGTSLGDPIEVGACMKLMGATPRNGPVPISCCKTNLGHTEGGSGFCGFAKCILQVANCEAAAGTHLRVVNSHLDMAGQPFLLPSETIPMRANSSFAGVSAFGYGGTNAHAEAWGKNIMTSRGLVPKDPLVIFQRKLAAAPPAEITMIGDDVSQWETTGLDPRAKPGSRWHVIFEEDGTAEWELDDELPDFGEAFFIRGTHTEWLPEELMRHESITGLWLGVLVIGSPGEECFQILADSDNDKVFHPEVPWCKSKAARVEGPSPVPKDFCWVLEGQPGDSFNIEFCVHRERLSLTWQLCLQVD